MKDQHEEAEDSIKGISQRLIDLESERTLIRKEISELQRLILVEKLKPLIDEYNKYGEKVAPVLVELWGLIDRLGGIGRLQDALCPL